VSADSVNYWTASAGLLLFHLTIISDYFPLGYHYARLLGPFEISSCYCTVDTLLLIYLSLKKLQTEI